MDKCYNVYFCLYCVLCIVYCVLCIVYCITFCLCPLLSVERFSHCFIMQKLYIYIYIFFLHNQTLMYVLNYIYLLGVLASFVMFSNVFLHVVYLEDSMVYTTSSFRAIVIFMYIYFESIVGFQFIWELNITRSRKFVLLSRDLIKHHFQKP